MVCHRLSHRRLSEEISANAALRCEKVHMASRGVLVTMCRVNTVFRVHQAQVSLVQLFPRCRFQ